MNANANKAPFKQSSPSRSLSPLCISPYKEINHSLVSSAVAAAAGGGRRARGKTASCGTVTSLFFFCRDMKERRDSNDVSGIPPGKVEGLKGKMRALLVFIHPPFPLFLVALIKQGKERERERERESEGGRQRESLRSLP